MLTLIIKNVRVAAVVASLGVAGLNFAVAGAPVNKQYADRILLDGFIYTMEPGQPNVEAVAIKDGKIMALGSSAQMRKLGGAKTDIIDLKGRMVMPGLIDGHSHPVVGALGNLFECKFEFSATAKDIARTLKKCVKKNPVAKWIIGGRWSSNFFKNNNIASPRQWLDQYSGDKAVYFSDDSGHNGWANTKALHLAAITKNTKDPEGGKIIRDSKTGIPNGLLLEDAQKLMTKHLPDWTAAQYQAAVREMTRIANGFGITGIKDANAREAILKAYHDVDQAGDLSLHIAACIATPYGHREKPLDYSRIERMRDKYASTHVDTRYVKIFLDGVPTVARSAAMLAPYVADKNFPKNWRGFLHIDQATLTKDITELEKRGFTVKMHAAGDRAVHEGLNAIEKAHQNSGRSDLRHELAHAGFVAPADIPRFRQLNVVADLSPYIWYPSPIIQSVLDALGKRGEHYWPIRDYLKAGAPLLAGSDWPSAVASMNPWIGIAAMVTRRDPFGKTPGALWPAQAITLKQALRIFTIDGARALRLGAKTGSIKVGKVADMIILEQNLFTVNPDDIARTSVEMTLFAGKIVYQKPAT